MPRIQSITFQEYIDQQVAAHKLHERELNLGARRMIGEDATLPGIYVDADAFLPVIEGAGRQLNQGLHTALEEASVRGKPVVIYTDDGGNVPWMYEFHRYGQSCFPVVDFAELGAQRVEVLIAYKCDLDQDWTPTRAMHAIEASRAIFSQPLRTAADFEAALNADVGYYREQLAPHLGSVTPAQQQEVALQRTLRSKYASCNFSN